MTIETKYNIGDEVWLMYRNKTYNAYVEKVIPFNDITTYMLRSFAGKRRYPECDLYPTKEELLKSL